MRRASRSQGGASLAERLRSRRPEIEQATLARVKSLSELPKRGGPEYADGLRRAVAAGIEYGIGALEGGEDRPIPDVLLSQARLAARSGVGLDTVLRRYVAGHALLEDFLVEEAGEDFGQSELKGALRSQAGIVDSLLAAVSSVYTKEAERLQRSAERRRMEQVERLLVAEPLGASELAYDFGGWHIGVLAAGAEGKDVPSALAASIDCRLLAIPREEDVVWAWLAFRRCPDPGRIMALVPDELPAGNALAIGEPGEGLAGWRRNHEQARAAFAIALRNSGSVARYADVALLASALQDDLLATSLRELYLGPLSEERKGVETLCAYFAADRNVTSTAASLGVTRKTVVSRLRSIERALGRPIDACAAELEVALRLGPIAHER